MLWSALQVGRSALSASSLATQVVGNNIANAATPGYSRQVVDLAALSDQQWGRYFVGRGVEVASVRRMVDEALQQRIMGGLSGEAYAATDQSLMGGLEQLVNSLSDSSINNQLSKFFDSWSRLANTPGEPGARALVVQQGKQLVGSLRTLRQNLVQTRTQIDSDLATSVNRANDLLSQVAGLNAQIVSAENGQGSGSSGANALRDRRDQLLTEVAKFMDITTIPQPSGAVDVLVGSTPVVLSGQSRGLQLKSEAIGDDIRLAVTTAVRPEELTIRSGRVGALLNNRGEAVDATLDTLDRFAGQLIFQVNRLHSQGGTQSPLTSVTGATPVRSTDYALAFNDPTNQTFAELPFKVQSGQVSIRVKNTQTGASELVTIPIDADGLDAALQPGFTNDTSLESLRDAINASVPNVTASITGDGRLKIDAAPGYTMSFESDTSGVLAVLGMNTYFTGKNAADIGVRAELESSPGLLAVGSAINGNPSDNGTALAITGLRSATLSDLGLQTLGGFWDSAVQSVATRAGGARVNADAATLVREGLEAQREAASGVSIDEESINLINFQRQYQAGARYLSVVNDLTQTLLQLV